MPSRHPTSRRIALRSAALLVLSTFALGVSHAQEAAYPTRPIRIVVPFTAGGQTDVAARLVGQVLGESMKTSVIIDNKPGAHGLIGGADVARAAADGYTLLMASSGFFAINPVLYEKMPFDTNRDFAPVSHLITVPMVLMVSTQRLPMQTVAELVTYLKSHPGTVNCASAGIGGSSHLVAEYFKYGTGTNMTHIPYKGEAPATTSVVGGEADLGFNMLVGTVPHMKSGKIRVLATTSRERLAELPDVPTVAEALGMKDFEATTWTALYAPAGTPPDIIKRLSGEVSAALRNPAVAKRLKELGAVPAASTPEQLGELLRSDQDKWRKVIQALGTKAE